MSRATTTLTLTETASAIDKYSKRLVDRTNHGDLDFGVDSLSLAAYVNHWANQNGIDVEDVNLTSELPELVRELKEFGIEKISELSKIVPADYAKVSKEIGDEPTILGVVRDWMIINDWRRFRRDVKFNWLMSDSGIIQRLIPQEDILNFKNSFDWDDEN